MATRGRRRSPRRKRKRSPSSDEESSGSSSNDAAPPKKKQKNNKKKEKKEEKEIEYVYIVQGRLEGLDEDEQEFDSDQGYPAGFDSRLFDVYKTKTKANASAIRHYKKNTNKKYHKISKRNDYENGLFDKTSAAFQKRNMPDGWGFVQYRAWVTKKKLND